MAGDNHKGKRPYQFHGDWKHRSGTEDERFWEKVDTSGDCWEWTAATIGAGYGYFHSHFERYAHRWSYRKLVGEIPEGLHIDHLCRNTRCVNPAHLEPVTPQENNRRRPQVRSTHCKRGHEWNDENTKHMPNGTRICRPCMRLLSKRRYQAAKGGVGA